MHRSVVPCSDPSIPELRPAVQELSSTTNLTLDRLRDMECDPVIVAKLSAQLHLDPEATKALLVAADGDPETAVAIHVGYNGGEMLAPASMAELAQVEEGKRQSPDDPESKRARESALPASGPGRVTLLNVPPSAPVVNLNKNEPIYICLKTQRTVQTAPHPRYDEAAWQLFQEDPACKVHIPFLYGISREAFHTRRVKQRKEILSGQGFMLDVLDHSVPPR